MSVRCKDCDSTLTTEEVEYLEHTCSQCELEAHMAFQESEMSEAQTMSDDREPCEECNDCGLVAGPQGHQVYCGCVAGLMAFEQNRQKARTITRADIPEALVREIQAEGLERAGSIRVRGIDEYCNGWNEAMSRVRKEAAKLREQK